MTRKRFIKLMMAQGYCRNSVTVAAMLARLLDLSYEAAYHAASSSFGELAEGLANDDNE